MWWQNLQLAIEKLHSGIKYDPLAIGAIGIAYQMHGLVLVNKTQQVLRDSIIWCDSRAVPYGDAAFEDLGIGTILCLQLLRQLAGNRPRDFVLPESQQH